MSTSPRFRSDLFNQAVRDYGYDVLIEKSEMCSCYQEEQSESTPVCPRCKGLKFIWKPYGVVRALITNISEKNNQYLDFSMVKQGDKMMTLQEVDKVAVNDRIKALNTYETYTEVLIPIKYENGYNLFEPYFDIAEVLEAKQQDGKEVDLKSIVYNEVTGFITVSDDIEKLSIRYSYHPYYLVSNIPHTNRQQFDVPGNLMKLPGQYFLSRITAPVKTNYDDSLVKRGLVLDFSETDKAFLNCLAKTQSQMLTLEFAFDTIEFQEGEEVVILSRSEHYNSLLMGKATASGSLQIEYSDNKPDPGDNLVFIRDKYIPELTFKDFEFNSMLTYLGGEILRTSSWLCEIPEEGTQIRVVYDYISDRLLNRVFTFLNSKWVLQTVPFKLIFNNFKLYLQVSDSEVQDLGVQLVEGKNYIALILNNVGRFLSGYIYCNGTRFQLSDKTYLNGILANADLYSNANILKRVYNVELTQYELAQNKNYLCK